MAISRREQRDNSAARVVIHDFSGHPFQVQLARHLARRGAESYHLYCASFQTPHGNVADEEERFESIGVRLRTPFAKYSGIRRLFHELEYGWRLAMKVRRIDPDVVVSANTPLIAAGVFQAAMKIRRTPVVFWHQDVYSVAIAAHITRRRGWIGAMFGAMFVQLERWLLRTSAQVVVISEDFLAHLRGWRIDPDRTHVIENWAPLDEIPERPASNRWSTRHGIGPDDVVFLYAGTLGLKHEPSVLAELARTFADRSDVRVLVASEGMGASWLEEQDDLGTSIELLPFQPYSDLPDMLASADVLLVLLEHGAGGFSVPSKVLSYHCAGRAILGAMPTANLASRIIESNGSGVVVPPGDADAFVAAAERLSDDPAARAEMGRRARGYAEQTFDIELITDRFVAIIDAAVGPGGRHIDATVHASDAVETPC